MLLASLIFSKISSIEISFLIAIKASILPKIVAAFAMF